MRRIILICVILCNALSAIQSRRAVEWRRHHNNSATIAIGNDLYTVSQVGRAAINVRTSKEAKVDCIVRENPRVNYIDGRLRAAALNDNRTVVLWAEQWTRDPSKKRYFVQLIDPWQCYTKGLLTVEDEVVPSDFPSLEPQVVIIDGGFDFYLPSRRRCSPCRFDDRGKNVYLRRQIDLEDAIDAIDGFLVEPISSAEAGRGYIYVTNFRNGTAVMRILNGDFDVVKELFVDHRIDVLSANYNREPLVIVCYSKLTEGNQQIIKCDGLDDNLQSKFSVRPHLPVVLSNAKVTLKIDLFGNAHVGVAYYDVKNQMLQRRYFRYDKIGVLVDKVVFTGLSMKNDPKFWELFGYPLEQKYYLTIAVRREVDTFESDEVIECVDLIDSDN